MELGPAGVLDKPLLAAQRASMGATSAIGRCSSTSADNEVALFTPRGAPGALSRPLNEPWDASFGRPAPFRQETATDKTRAFTTIPNIPICDVQEDGTSPSPPTITLSYLKKRFRATRRRRAMQNSPPKASKFNRKFDYQGSANPSNTHQSVHVAPALVPARGIRQ